MELKPDLDQVEGLSAEREALWARIEKVSFLTQDEKRAAVGYGPAPREEVAPQPDADAAPSFGGDTVPFVKYAPDQPRVPAGNSDGGQWTDGGGGGSAGRVQVAQAGRAKVVRELLKRLFGSKPELPGFLVKRSASGKIIGRIDDLTDAEKRFANELKDLGHDVEIVPRAAGRTPDLRINGKPHEYKIVEGLKATDEGGISAAISNRILNARGQAADVIVDGRSQAGMTRDAAERAVRRAYGADTRKGINSITILTADGPVYMPRKP